MKNYIRRAVVVQCSIPPEVQIMLHDFRDMVNWLISWALHSREHNKYKMLAVTTDWFEKNWRGKYAAHYHEAACSLASQQLSSWSELGGDTSALPHLTKPMARLRTDLFKLSLKGNDLIVRFVLAPKQFVYLTTKVFHGKLSEYELGSLGEMNVFSDRLNLVWRVEDTRARAEDNAGIDTNFGDIVVATDRIERVSLSKITEIQKRYRDERKHIQQVLAHNPAKQQKVLARRSKREHNRVEDIIRKEVVPDLLAKTVGYGIAFDDLRTTSEECITVGGKRFNERLSAWIHGQVQTITNDKSPTAPMRPVYTRGTSTWCPFCGTRLTHPTWKQSKCTGCGLLYDRDALSAVSTKIRSLTKHKKGTPWALAKVVLSPEVLSSLQRDCTIQVLPCKGQETHEPPFEQCVREVPDDNQVGGLLQSASSSTGDGRASLTFARANVGHETVMTPMTQNDTKYEGLVDCNTRLYFQQPCDFSACRI